VVSGKEDILNRSEIDAALADLPDWRYRQGGLVTVFKTPTAAAALELIAAVGQLAEEQNHHPDLDWRYNRVFIRFTSHDAGTQVTRRDVAAAAGVSRAAAAVSAVAEPERYRSAETATGTAD
jgi:4a-hydroxytetrahydrobiopterin dehydratase